MYNKVFDYRSPRLQWHCLQWHPSYSDTFGMSQMIGLLLNYLWLQWQSGYSDTFPMSRGCHCKRGRLYFCWPVRLLCLVLLPVDGGLRGGRPLALFPKPLAVPPLLLVVPRQLQLKHENATYCLTHIWFSFCIIQKDNGPNDLQRSSKHIWYQMWANCWTKSSFTNVHKHLSCGKSRLTKSIII